MNHTELIAGDRLLQPPDRQHERGSGPSPQKGDAPLTRLLAFFGCERSLPVALGLVFLPWIAAVFYMSGWWTALHLLAYAAMVLTIGYGIIGMALPASSRTQVFLLAPALGILTISALTAFWLRLGLPLIWAPALWVAPLAVGVFYLWRDRASWAANRNVPHGFALALLSLLICAVCFLPAASTDMVQLRDGSFNWRYTDTQQFYAIAESIKDGVSPPRTPGTVTEPLLYHFGAYAPAAAISRLDGLDLGDAVARVTRGAELWALVLSCFALGMLLSLKATGRKFGAIMTVAGLFFYGPLVLLIPFNGPFHGSGGLIGLFSRISSEGMLAAGIPYDHLLSGHSVLHGLIAITAIMGLCLAEKARDSAVTWRGFTLLALPALAVPVNSLASVYCVSVVAILLFWGRLRAIRPWLSIALMFCLFLGAWKIIGYSHSPDAQLVLNRHVPAQWWMLLMWFLTALGFRIVGFRWISQSWKEPLSALVLISVLGWLTMSLLFVMRDGTERYGIYFLQSIFSIFAFSRVTSRWWHGAERLQLITDWLRPAIKGMIFLVSCGFLIGIDAYITHTKTGIDYYVPKLILASSLLGFLAAVWVLMRRSRSFARVASAILMCVLLAGFLAWSPDWARYARGQVHTDITYPPGEVRGLRRLGELMAPGDVFATNQHDANTKESGRGRSNGYSALSGRPVLLEGYLPRGENMLPWFSDLLHDNDLLFSTTDPETLRATALKWHVRFLVARPGTDIALPRPLPPWLIEEQNTGDLRIYRIN